MCVRIRGLLTAEPATLPKPAFGLNGASGLLRQVATLRALLPVCDGGLLGRAYVDAGGRSVVAHVRHVQLAGESAVVDDENMRRCFPLGDYSRLVQRFLEGNVDQRVAEAAAATVHLPPVVVLQGESFALLQCLDGKFVRQQLMDVRQEKAFCRKFDAENQADGVGILPVWCPSFQGRLSEHHGGSERRIVEAEGGACTLRIV
eukprot:7214-Prymnesium_polylepis.2